jgi:hypothetical protein
LKDEDKMVTLQQAKAASERIEADLSRAFGPSVPGVHNLAIAWGEDGELCVRVNVDDSRRKDVSEKLPAEIDGVKVRVESTEEKTVRYQSVRKIGGR